MSKLKSALFFALITCAANSQAKETHSLVVRTETKGTVLLTLPDFKKAETEARGGKTILKLSLNAASAERLQNYSHEHLNTKLALELDQNVIAAPTLKGPILGDQLEIDALSSSEAKEIATVVNHR